jgi:hypothetical protein
MQIFSGGTTEPYMHELGLISFAWKQGGVVVIRCTPQKKKGGKIETTE